MIVAPHVLAWVDRLTRFNRSDDVLARLAESVKKLEMKKSMIGWGLEELEALTREDAERGPDSDDESEDEVERMLPAPL